MNNTNARIIGIMLIKNEDIYIKESICSIIDFCDKIIIADNYSYDNTWKIVSDLSSKYEKIRACKVNKPSDSHDLISDYAGKPVWIFGVDGDEIYEPDRLSKLRTRLLDGEFNEFWNIFGNSFHCIDDDRGTNTARGYMAPPSKSITKLYNFAVIDSWSNGGRERLHGGKIVFRNGHSKKDVCRLYEKYDWNDSPFRCLHMAFVKRSSRGDDKGRLNPAEIRKNKRKFYSHGIRQLVRSVMGKGSAFKNDQYAVGPISDIHTDKFLGRCPDDLKSH